MFTPEQTIERINERFGKHVGYRALHAKGTLHTGTFTATPEAAELTSAAHMQGDPVPALARISNGGGDPTVPDYVPDIRGLAVKFTLPDDSKTDIVSQSLPHFPFHGVDPFVEMLRVTDRSLGGLARLPFFLAKNPGVIGALRTNAPALKTPQSYATMGFYAIHAYRWTTADGRSRFVRYTWLPEAGDRRIPGKVAKERGRDYLREELAERIAREPVRYRLELQVAGEGDDPDDPGTRWPADRERVQAGTLELTATTEEGDGNIFDPMRLTEGIEPSADPILIYRPKAYSLSYERRAAASK